MSDHYIITWVLKNWNTLDSRKKKISKKERKQKDFACIHLPFGAFSSKPEI